MIIFKQIKYILPNYEYVEGDKKYSIRFTIFFSF